MKWLTDIRNNIERLNGLNQFISNQVKVLNILFMVDEIFTGESKQYKLSGTKYLLLKSKSDKKKLGILEQKSDKQPDTTGIPDLESEESAEQRRNQQGQGLKILTPNQMLRRLPISLAQLNAGNNSENEMKLGKYCILCTDQENLQNKSKKV